jgi:hypothetical protein
MRFEEKIADGRVAKFAVIFGRRYFRSAVMAGWKLGVRDVFFFSDPRRDEYRVTLRYLDYESLDFGLFDRLRDAPPWNRGWNLNKWPAEEVVRLEAERRKIIEELERKLFDPQLCVELPLPYRLGPLGFLQATEAKNPYMTRCDLEGWPETLRPLLMSLADHWGTQVVFVPEFHASYVMATAGPDGVHIFQSPQTAPKLVEGVRWSKGRINLISPGSSSTNRFCVCDLEKEQVFWLKYKQLT